MQDCMSLANEKRTLVASIKEEMAEHTNEIEYFKTRMAKEIVEYKLLVMQQEEQLMEGSTNTEDFDQVHIYCVAKHTQEMLLFTFVV